MNFLQEYIKSVSSKDSYVISVCHGSLLAPLRGAGKQGRPTSSRWRQNSCGIGGDFKTQLPLPGSVGVNVIRRCNKRACRFILAAAVRAPLAMRAGEIDSGDPMVRAVHGNGVSPFGHSSVRLFKNRTLHGSPSHAVLPLGKRCATFGQKGSADNWQGTVNCSVLHRPPAVPPVMTWASCRRWNSLSWPGLSG